MSTTPGWYPDPQSPQLQRWWDGSSWSTHTAPAPPAVSSGLVTLGWFTALLFPIVGLGIGIAVADKTREGSWIVAVSILSGIVWFAVWMMMVNARPI